MSTKTKGRIHLVYGICLGALIVAVGVCFALSCLSIYESGDSPFTRESISAHFSRIAVPTWLCILGVIGGGVLSLALPLEGAKVKSRRDPEAALSKACYNIRNIRCLQLADMHTLNHLEKQQPQSLLNFLPLHHLLLLLLA